MSDCRSPATIRACALLLSSRKSRRRCTYRRRLRERREYRPLVFGDDGIYRPSPATRSRLLFAPILRSEQQRDKLVETTPPGEPLMGHIGHLPKDVPNAGAGQFPMAAYGKAMLARFSRPGAKPEQAHTLAKGCALYALKPVRAQRLVFHERARPAPLPISSTVRRGAMSYSTHRGRWSLRCCLPEMPRRNQLEATMPASTTRS